MLIIMVLYTILNFYVLRKNDLRWQNRVCRKQIFLVFLLQCLGYLILYLRTEDTKILAFYGFQVAFFLMYFILFKTIYPQCSRVLLSNLVFLFSLGLLMITRLDFDRAKKQFAIGVIACLITLVIPAIIRHMRFLSRWAWFYAIVGIGLVAGAGGAAAIRVCEDFLCVLHGIYVPEGTIFRTGSDHDGCSRCSCADPGGIHGSGERTGLLHVLPVHDLCGDA